MRIQAAGRDVAYDDTGGGGVPLVLVHGFPMDRRIWAAQASALAGVARLIAPDLRGFGETPGAGAAATMDDYADDVLALLDALGLRTAVVGGVSMGGYVAMALHRRAPDRVRALVLVDTRGGPDSAEGRSARDAMIAMAREKGAGAVAQQMIGRLVTPGFDAQRRKALTDLMAAQSVDGIAAGLAAIRDRPDSRPGVARVAVPTLVVCGAEDVITPPAESEALHAAIPGSRLVLVPGAGHLPNMERPREFNKALRGFVAELG